MARSNFIGMQAEASELYRTLRRNVEDRSQIPDPSPYVEHHGSPSKNDTEIPCRRLATKLQDLMEDLQDRGLSPAEQNREFFVEASAITFSLLSDLPGDVLADRGFWRYLAVYHLYDIVSWQYPSDNGDRWGTNGTQFVRSMPLALFIRGQLLSSKSAEDREIAARIQDVDIWTSHVAAVQYGSSPDLVLEFLRVVASWQDPKTHKFSGVRREQLRELARLLTAARSNFVVELMDRERCRQLVLSLVPEAERRGDLRAETKRAKNASSE